MDGMTALPQVASELRALMFLLGGGMSLLILKEVFTFVKTIKKNGDSSQSQKRCIDTDKWSAHTAETSTAHIVQLAGLTRIETALLEQTKALIEVTERLRQTNTGNK